MKGVRALTSGMLVLVAACAVPAISAAQDAGTATDPAGTTTTTAPTQALPPSTTTPDATPAGAAAGTPGEPPPNGQRTADTPLGGDSPPADGPAGGAVASSSNARKASSSSVSMVNFAFSPASVTVHVGDTVTWSNQDDAPHNATANDGSFKTPDINKGQSASHTFNSPGTFSYICTIHPNMHGTVRVLSASGSGGGGGGNGNAGSSSSGSSQSEASAVASPSAAGDSNTLPMTGMAVGALALVGLALLNSGLLVRAWQSRAERKRQLKLF